MDFPCDFVIKIMGAATANLEVELLPTLKKHIPNIQPSDISVRDSKGAKFKSISVKLKAQSQEQLDALYREISARPDVLMVL